MAHKGTSVVLYRSPALRQHQYTAITDWTGGLYISPGFAGSRSGALISTAWAALVYLGRDGYVDITRCMMQVQPVSSSEPVVQSRFSLNSTQPFCHLLPCATLTSSSCQSSNDTVFSTQPPNRRPHQYTQACC